MPTFTIFLNIPRADVPFDFLTSASTFIANQLGKSEKFVTVRVVPDQMMCHGGSVAPCGSVQVASIGALGDKNNEHTKAIGDFLEQHLKIPKDRFYINFYDIPRNDCGFNGSTFAK